MKSLLIVRDMSVRIGTHAFLCCFLLVLFAHFAIASEIQPLLEFPEAGMDDPVRYQEYRTRFYRDSAKNAVQIYLNNRTGRVVNLWADAANESLSFTARDGAGKPVSLKWCDTNATATSARKSRYLQYSLCADATTLQLGHFLLSSMRKERDFQYFKKDLEPYASDPFHEPELITFIGHIDKLSDAERKDHLQLLNAATSNELRKRMEPSVTQKGNVVSLEQKSFDGKNHLWLELSFGNSSATVDNKQISVKSSQPVRFDVKVGTDSPALTPLERKDIFNESFFKFYSEMQRKGGSEFQWLEREVRGMELVCYQEKLMAGLPNFATYFGRDTMMSAFMFEAVWSSAMMEHAITSVLRKLGPRGDASHEEALGGQAIRENLGEYNKLIEEYLASPNRDTLKRGRTILQDLQKVRENFNMVDDDFQLPVLIGRYLGNPEIPSQRKRAFLSEWLVPITKNFAFVAAQSRPYVDQPQPIHLVSFPKRQDGGWQSSSWRDSNAGYAGGRFAMDVNAVWVPVALQSIATSLQYFGANGIKIDSSELTKVNPEGSKLLMQYRDDPKQLEGAIERWRGAIQHFWVRLSRDEVLKQANAKLDSLPQEEKNFWKKLLSNTGAIPERFEFLALSLDERGNPIPVLNTDPATWLFLVDHTENIAQDRIQPATIYKVLDSFVLPYPVGLFVENLGPLCANDAYASPAIWDSFEKDQYHSPRVVWGREVNLLTLGLMKQILDASETKSVALRPYVDRLRQTLKTIRQGVEGSGLKHNELWSYKINDGKLTPVRYGSSSDIQLWNLTDISIQYLLSRME